MVSAAPINRIDATGITMSNLFSGWPIDRIAQIYDSPIAPDPAYCANARRFSGADIASVRLAKRALGGFRALRNSQLANQNQVNVASVQTLSNDLGMLAAVSDVVPFKVPSELLEWATEFSPEIIYTLLGGSRICELVAQLADHLEKPIVPHFMDDWPSTLYESHRLRSAFRSVMNRRLFKVLSNAPMGLAIGSEMAEELQARYKKKFDYFMNCVELRDLCSEKTGCDSKPVRFGYVGGLHLNRWQSLLALSNAIFSYASFGNSISLEICAPVKDVDLYGIEFGFFSSVVSLKTISPDEVNAALATYDVLVHAESFSPADARYTKLSVSTKIPQYMAAARPILAIGPSSLSSIKYVKQSQAGLVVTEEGVSPELTEAVEELAKSESRRNELGQAGYRIALERHNAVSERARFASILAVASQMTA